jgi:hypothetical protein
MPDADREGLSDTVARLYPHAQILAVEKDPKQFRLNLRVVAPGAPTAAAALPSKP